MFVETYRLTSFANTGFTNAIVLKWFVVNVYVCAPALYIPLDATQPVVPFGLIITNVFASNPGIVDTFRTIMASNV